MSKTIILAAGGTSGHLYPALVIGKRLKDEGYNVIFVGSNQRIESKLVPEEDFEFIGLDIRPINSPYSLHLMIKAFLYLLNFIKDKNPCYVMGFGNYITVPVLLAALCRNKNIYLHEQNIKLGKVNKLFYRFARRCFTSFKQTVDYVSPKYAEKLLLTGNPIRNEFYTLNREEQRKALGIGDDKFVLLITGGSLGAKNLNEQVIKNIDRLMEDKNLIIYWSTGATNYLEVCERLSKYKDSDSIVIKPYFREMPEIMIISDFVISRAGASIISEIIAAKLPFLLVPYMSKDVGQLENAKYISKKCKVRYFNENNINRLFNEFISLKENDAKLNEIKSVLQGMKVENPAINIVNNLGY